MLGLVLAAGRGVRLRPLTDRWPKPMLPVADVPLLAWAVEGLATVASDLVVNVSHLRDAFEQMRGRAELFFEPEPLGTAGTLRALRDRAGGGVITHNADLVTDLAPVRLLEAHRDWGAPATVAARRVSSGADLTDAPDGRVRFVDRRAARVAGLQFIGMAVFERAALELLPDHAPAGLGETLLAALAARGELRVYVHEGYALDAGTPERYLRANLDVATGIAGAPRGREIPGTVQDGTYLGPGARGRAEGSVLMRGAVVEPGARIAGSVVMPGETVPRGTVLRDGIWFDARPIVCGP